MTPKPSWITPAQVRRWIPKRPAESHKGMNGHVLVVAGSRGMAGASVLCALGALRAGSGLVTLAVPEGERAAAAIALPECLTLGLPETPAGAISGGAVETLERYAGSHTVNAFAIGPGLSVNAQTAQALRRILDEFDLPAVLDADGLNNLRGEDLRGHGQLVITPHPVELSRLTGSDRNEIRRDRAGSALRVARDLEVICVLKGRHTIVSDGRAARINPTGNPAMAAGGMGDILTGAIAGLVAQGLDLFSAASAGAYLHGLAADLARVSDRGLLAREAADRLPAAFRKLGVR